MVKLLAHRVRNVNLARGLRSFNGVPGQVAMPWQLVSIRPIPVGDVPYDLRSYLVSHLRGRLEAKVDADDLRANCAHGESEASGCNRRLAAAPQV